MPGDDYEGWGWAGTTMAILMLVAVVTFGVCAGVCGIGFR